MEWIRTRRREIILGGFYRTLELHLRCSLQWVPVPFGPVLPFLSLLGRYSKLWGVWKTENWIMATFWSNLFFFMSSCFLVPKFSSKSQWVPGIFLQSGEVFSSSVSRSVVSDSLLPHGLQPPGSSVRGFSRQDYWSGLPSPSPGDLPDPGIEPRSPAWQADSLPYELQGSPDKVCGFPWVGGSEIPPSGHGFFLVRGLYRTRGSSQLSIYDSWIFLKSYVRFWIMFILETLEWVSDPERCLWPTQINNNA